MEDGLPVSGRPRGIGGRSCGFLGLPHVLVGRLDSEISIFLMIYISMYNDLSSKSPRFRLKRSGVRADSADKVNS